ncbi:MAG: xanthine dehydrogenase family protein molybdopterin-binding subunit [Pseudomonadota bacterium]|nr:xanthine dehydrogenase family protein molybdopterin-binding subunit [Pseudomonadota bacterium]
MKFGIGQRATRTEDPTLVSGQGRYTDDVDVPGALRGLVWRSPVAHGVITHLDVQAARDVPGVLAILTRDELAADKIGNLLCLTNITNEDGSKHPRPPRTILATERVRHVGEPVAFIVAETLAAARDAADLIEVEFDDLPVATDTYGAAQPGAATIWEQIPDNVCFRYGRGDKAAVDAAFDAADRIVSIRLVNNRLVSNPMEPRAAVADYDGESGRSTLYVPSQGPGFMLGQLAGMLKVEPAKLRLVTGNVGGGFGTRAFLYPEAALTLWASRRLQRPVRWTADRSEIFLSDSQGRDNVTISELAMDKDGHFKAIRATTYAAMGAYLANFGPFIPTDACSGMYTGLYKIPLCRVEVLGVMTNTVPTDAYRGAGRPEAAYMIERLVDKVALELGLTPDEVRRRNFPTPAEMPHTMGLGDVIDSGEFQACMEEAMVDADWAGFAARQAASAAAGKLRGIGMSTYVERCGGGGGIPAKLQFDTERGRLRILSGALDSGQGHAISYKQILSEKFGIDIERIDLVQGDTDIVPPGFTGGSKSIPVGGASVSIAADKVLEKGRKIAAQVLEAAEVDLEYADGRFAIAGTDRAVDLFDLAKLSLDPANLPTGEEPGLDAAHDHTNTAPTFPNGCHICEVEVDPETGMVEIAKYTVVDDFGVTLNPLMLEGQVHGGIGQGLGQAWTEHTVYDPESGQLLSGSFMDYQMPRADHLPDYGFRTRNVRCTTNPLGVKGAGEAGAIGAPPAFVNAVINAVRQQKPDVLHLDMPLTPRAVWEALRA